MLPSESDLRHRHLRPVSDTVALRAERRALGYRPQRRASDGDAPGRAAQVTPDVRTVNTYLRGCKMVGDVDAAAQAFQAMRATWRVSPDAPCYKLMTRLLAQGLRARAVEQLRADMEASHAGDTRTHLAPCMFWAQVRGPRRAVPTRSVKRRRKYISSRTYSSSDRTTERVVSLNRSLPRRPIGR